MNIGFTGKAQNALNRALHTITPELLETINLITVTMDGMKGANV